MDIELKNLRDKILDVSPLTRILKQGEALADTVRFVLPLEREGLNLTSLVWQVIALNDKNILATDTNLHVSVADGELYIHWDITKDYTSIATNNMIIRLVGTDSGGNQIVRFDGSHPITVEPLYDFVRYEPPDAWELAIMQISIMLNTATMAAESSQSSAASAAASAALANTIVADGMAAIQQMILNGFPVRDPVTGLTVPVQTALDNLFSLHRDGALTAAEYDALELTAAEYDAYQLTAFEYDTKGKQLLGGV
ncbi:hypothetical protein LJC49_10460 [Ruminococcaceae bacterium OttesenSCG-928-I18]|nr:hypothetical protein [Ruminococcaceae bacterium OttesenSCG-928-I18]